MEARLCRLAGVLLLAAVSAAHAEDPPARQFAERKPVPAAKPAVQPKPAPARELPSPGAPATLRAAIEDLRDTFGPRYAGAAGFLSGLTEIERAMAACGGDANAARKAQADFLALQRQALLANPLVADAPILFIVRQQYRPDHHNTETMFQTGEINTGSFRGGGAVKALDVRGGKVRTLLEVPKGVARDPDVSFDGRRVLFAMRRDVGDDYHIYDLAVDAPADPCASRELRRLTAGSGVTDIDPLYLPDERIAFSSTREPKYCMCNRHIMANLFRMEADGSNLEQIGRSTLHEGHGALTPDGRILYDRWEYVDRNFGDAQGVWTCNPDGTNHAVFYGNNTPSPGAVLDARIIPGAGGDRFVATYSSCHDRPWGAIAVVDRSRGIDSHALDPGRTGPEVHMWPAAAWRIVGRGNYDAFTGIWPKYEDPFPLAEAHTDRGAGRYFLCSRMTGQGEQMGIYLLDVFGNEILLHAEADERLGCFDPMPLGPRARPAVIPDRADLSAQEGSFYVQDVYVGTGMERARRGTVTHLRVVESPEKRSWTSSAWDGGTGQQAPGMAWDDFNNKRILGTAPVEADGSAYFRVPADRFVYFQLLDGNGMMVQSMRSGTIARPGEMTGCVGCHDGRQEAAANRPATALRREPRGLADFHGPPRLFNYLAEVQPVLDRHCVRCHDYDTDGGKKLLLAGDLGLIFNASYVELRGKRLVNVPGAGPAQTLPPYSWGSHASKLTPRLLKYLREGSLPRADFERIIAWIDINAPYYPTYASAYPDNLYGRSPLDSAQLKRLGGLTGVDLTGKKNITQVSFTRPERSPCLAGLRGKDEGRYAEALAIIRAGQALLARRPAAEMPGFQPQGIEAQREAKYQSWAAELERMRQAILAGRKEQPQVLGPRS